jgi:hypothetical protein
MKYETPEITLINRAVFAIQGIPKEGVTPDSQTATNPAKHQTAAAYEADE